MLVSTEMYSIYKYMKIIFNLYEIAHTKKKNKNNRITKKKKTGPSPPQINVFVRLIK